jgi:Flp pilus assembly protein TadB
MRRSDHEAMRETDDDRTGPSERGWRSTRKALAPVCGALGVLAAVWAYWLVVPGLVLGVVAVVLGWLARRDGERERGSVAIALGIVAVLLVPSVPAIADDAEQWGRDCALDPTHDPNC